MLLDQLSLLVRASTNNAEHGVTRAHARTLEISEDLQKALRDMIERRCREQVTAFARHMEGTKCGCSLARGELARV